MTIEAMKQALAALENHTAIKHPQQRHYRDSAIDALRAAIEEAEKQEPVAWMCADGTITNDPDRADWTWKPLYNSPRQWQGLTAYEIWQCNTTPPGSEVGYHICMAHQNVLDFSRAIEAKLKEKNT